MGKYVTDTVIQLEFLNVEAGDTTLLTIPSECDREEFARIIRDKLHDGGVVLTDCYIDHEFKLKGE